MHVAELNADFRDLIEALEVAQVEYVIVGAYAMAAPGLPRATADLDVLVRPSIENAARLIDALERFGAPHVSHGVSAADFTRTGTVYQMGLPPRRIDILTDITGVDVSAVFAAPVRAEVDGLTLSVIGRVELLENKRATARPKDLLDVAELERTTHVPKR